MTNGLKAQLELGADATGVEAGVNQAKKSLAGLGVAAAKEGKKASEGIEAIGAGGEAAATRVDRSTRNLINSIQRTTATLEAGGRSNSKYFETLASQRGVDTGALKPYLEQLDAVRSRQALATVELAKGGIQFDKYGVSAKQTAAAMRNVPAQLTDIIVGLQGGQAPLTVLLQQGGQLKDLFGGIVPAAKALGGAVIGLINPFTIAASVVGVLGLAYFQGSKEADAFARSIILSGNAAGVTVGQLSEMAERISEITGTQGAAAAALAEFAGAGTIASTSLERFTLVAIRMEKATGQAVKETVKQFAELGKSPVEASIKLNESTNFLTTSLFQQIRALESQGRTADAAALAQNALAEASENSLNKLESRLGSIERAWLGVSGAAKKAWDAMLNVGRPDTLEDSLKRAEERLAQLRSNQGAAALANRPLVGPATDPVGQAAQEVRILQSRIAGEARLADFQARSAAQTRARINFDKEGDKFLSNRAKEERAIAEARNLGLAAGASQLEIDKRIAAIRASFADKGAAKTALQIDKAELGLDLQAIKSASEQLIGTYTNSERILESIRSAGLIDDREYYEAKRAFINLDSQAKETAIKEELARLGQENLAGKEKIDNDRKIAEASTKLAMVRAEASSQLVVLSTQEAAAQKQVALAYLSARQAAEEYLAATNRQQERTLAGIGQGNQQRGRDAGINQIEDRYASQRLELENQRARLEFEGKFTEDARKQYDQRLALINEFQTKSIASFTSYYQKLTATQGNWALGAQESLRNYFETSQNVFQQVGDAVSRAFKGMEDALVNFVKTGKLDFKSLADSIIADIARIVIQKNITGPLAGLIGGFFGGGVSGPGAESFNPFSYAGGGYTGAGSRSGGMDGKGGFPAILHPNETVVDHSAGQGMGGNVTLNIINQTGTQVQGSVQQRGTGADGSQMLDLLLTSIADGISSGSGPISRSMESRYGLRTAMS